MNGKLAIAQLRNIALRNFERGIFRFKAFGNVLFQIVWMHDAEYGVITYDPVSEQRVEILRIQDAVQPYFI